MSCVMDEGMSTELGIVESMGSIACEVYMMFNFRPELLSLPHLNSYTDTPEKPYFGKVDRDDGAPSWWCDIKAGQ